MAAMTMMARLFDVPVVPGLATEADIISAEEGRSLHEQLQGEGAVTAFLTEHAGCTPS